MNNKNQFTRSFKLGHVLALGLLALITCKSTFALPTNFERTAWVTGLISPLAMRFAPDGRLFVNQQNGQIRIIKNGLLLPTPFATLNTSAGHRESMVGIALDPHFTQNGYVYVHYLGTNPTLIMKVTRLTSSKTNPDIMEPGSEILLLDSLSIGGYQGGALTFGKDGMLYIGSAHGGSKDPSNLHGKALRINPASYPNVIPVDNPFVKTPGTRPEIWSLGFREPFSGTTDTVNDRVVFNDVGEGGSEEVDILKKGANFGYESGCEGNCTNAGMENPWINLPHGSGLFYSCITGGTFYYGNSFPSEYRASYFFADYNTTQIATKSSDGTLNVFDKTTDKVIQLEVSPIDGALYALKIEGDQPPWKGTVQRIRYTGVLSVNDINCNANFGPSVNFVSTYSQTSLHFMLGNQKAKSVALTIYNSQGQVFDQIKTLDADSKLNWNFGAKAIKSGVYFYALKVISEKGILQEKKGSLFLLD